MKNKVVLLQWLLNEVSYTTNVKVMPLFLPNVFSGLMSDVAMHLVRALLCAPSEVIFRDDHALRAHQLAVGSQSIANGACANSYT